MALPCTELRRINFHMIPDPYTYRSANILIDQHGEDAPIFAAMQADKRAAAGYMEGRRVWMRVIGSRDGQCTR